MNLHSPDETTHPQDLCDLKDRLRRLEEHVGEIRAEVTRALTLLRGNGEEGLCAQVQLNRERIGFLQSQWRWILALLLAILAAAVQMIWRGAASG